MISEENRSVLVPSTSTANPFGLDMLYACQWSMALSHPKYSQVQNLIESPYQKVFVQRLWLHCPP